MTEAKSVSRGLLLTPAWWDRRCLSVWDQSRFELQLIDQTGLSENNKLIQAAETLLGQLTSMHLSSETWFVVVGSAAPLGIEVLRQASVAGGTLSLAGVLLISTARTRANYGIGLQRLIRLAKLSQGLGAYVYERHLLKSVMLEAPAGERNKLFDMWHQRDRALMRRSLQWQTQWQGSRLGFEKIRYPVHQFHGRQDLYYLPPSANDATLLGRAGHFLWFTHQQPLQNWVVTVSRKIS